MSRAPSSNIHHTLYLAVECAALLASGITAWPPYLFHQKLSAYELRPFMPWFFLCNHIIGHDALHACVNNSCNNTSPSVLSLHAHCLFSADGSSLLWYKHCGDREKEYSWSQQWKDYLTHSFLSPVPFLLSSNKGYSLFYLLFESHALLPFYFFSSLDYSSFFSYFFK